MRNIFLIFFLLAVRTVSSQTKLYILFQEQNYDSIQSMAMGRILGNKIPDSYVLKHFDKTANIFDKNMFNGNKKSYYPIARIKEGDFWVLVLCSYDGIYKDIYLCSYDEKLDEIISKLHVKRELCGIEENVSFSFYRNNAMRGEQEIIIKRIFPCSIEGEPTLQHEKYKLNRQLTRIEKDDIVFKNGVLGYDTITFNQINDTLMAFNEILELFPNLTNIQQIPTTPPSNLFLLNKIPYEVVVNLFKKIKNECEYNTYNRYPLFYYAVGKIRIKNNWILCYCETDTYDNNMYLAIIPCNKERVSSEILLYNNHCNSQIKNNYIYNSFNYPNWHDGVSMKRKERYLIGNTFTKYNTK